MKLTRRSLIQSVGLSLAAAGVASRSLAKTSGQSEALFVTDRDHPEPAPMGYDRLPLSWYQATTRRLKERLKPQGIDAIVLQRDPNLVYFSGCFRGSGERTTWVMFRMDEDDTAYWFSPGIDRDLITSWWCTENDYYFCYPHAEGGFPNLGDVKTGPAVDLFGWMLSGLQKHELEGKRIGIDIELSPAQLAAAKKRLPGATFVNISEHCMHMQVRKTPEEIALTQRAYRYFDKIHAFSRDFILEHGTNTTDFAIGEALRTYGINLLMEDIQHDGRPHNAVGILVTSEYVRAGIATSYPHPNQFFHAPVEKGQSVYVNTDIKIGGCGGEGYRNYLVAPWTKHQDKLWEVVAETVEIMNEKVKPGAVCHDVAKAVHEHQVKRGMRDYIYHRPGHGTGQNFVGHQPPYLALGDETVIEEGMMFSVEPGLMDPSEGVGINPSDNLLVTKNGSVMQTRVPFSKEWSYLTL
jgi:Xaa-Pro aminopeptidase